LPTGKLKFKRRERQGGIVAATNDALLLASGAYIVFMDHDDLLHQDALLEIALTLKQGKNYKVLYTDSTLIDLAGRLMHVYHKPDWSPDTLRHMNYMNHLTVVEREMLSTIGGLRVCTEGSQDWDMLLRLDAYVDASEVCHIRKPLYAWRAAQESVAYSAESKPEAFRAGIKVATEHLARKGLLKPRCIQNPHGPGVSNEWEACSRSIEIIIPTHNNLEGLKKCLEGLLTATDYPTFSISIIANRCSNPDMLEFLALQSAVNSIKIIDDARDFNWAALNNSVAFNSQADLLVFMNDDVEVTHADWLRLLARQFDVEGVGVVGATLLYGNGELQHNGVHTHTDWVAENIQSTGAFGELRVTRNVAAVTGACMAVACNLFKAIDGFDERLAVNYNDVDFCLAARQAGYRVVQISEAVLIHHESISRGRLDNDEKKALLALEAQFMRDKWGGFLNDPYWTHYEIYAYGTRILHVD
jgi:GT2 family glycosyltransferase